MRISKALLCSVLTRLLFIIDRAATLPIVRCVRLHARAGRLVAAATDLTTWVRCTIPARGSLLACVDARALRDVVRPAGRADRDTLVIIEASPDSKSLVVRTPDSVVTLDAQSAGDYPAHPTNAVGRRAWRPEGSWPAELTSAMSWVLRAVGGDPSRPNIRGVYMDREALCGTDGYRLHRAPMAGLASGPVLLPSSSARALVRTLPSGCDVAASRAGDAIRFVAGDVEIVTKAIPDAEFPPYQQVIPRGGGLFHAVLDPVRLRSALAKLPRPRGGGQRLVRWRLNGLLTIEYELDGSASSVRVPLIETGHKGPDFLVGLDTRFVEDALADADERVTAIFHGDLDPVVLKPTGRRVALVMPART